MRRRNEIPESDKMIIVYNDDFCGDYSVEGKFIDYKKPIKKGKRIFASRFCVYDKNSKTWQSMHEEFKTSKGWDYIKNEKNEA